MKIDFVLANSADMDEMHVEYCSLYLSLYGQEQHVHPYHAGYFYLSYDVTSGSEITPCNKICKPLVVYRFTPEMRFQTICHMIHRI